MAFTPTKSPLYGGSPLTIRLTNDHQQLNHSSPFFVIFEGSRRRHTVSSRYSDASGLVCTLIPGHDHAEDVQVSLVQLSNEMDGLGSYSTLVQGYLNYECDTTVHLAKFLTSSVYNNHALDKLELIKSDHFDLSNEVLPTLDVRLNLALQNADLSSSWHLLGGDSLSDAVCDERETLLHFCARLGLMQVAHFLLEQPGAEDALRLPNRHGELPFSIAHKNGYYELAEMFSGYNTQGIRPSMQQEVVDIAHGVVRILDNGTVSMTSFIDSSNMERSIDNELDFLRQTEEMIRMQQDICNQQNYSNSDWPEDIPSQHSPGVRHPFPASASEQELQDSMQRLLMTQQVNRQTLQGLMNYPQANDTNSIEVVRRQEDERSDPGALIDEALYPVLEKSIAGVHDLSESLFQMREKSLKSKMSQALRRKHLNRFSSSCPNLFQQNRSLMSVPEFNDDHFSAPGDNRHGRQARSMSYSTPQGKSSLSDDIFDPRIYICISGVTTESSEAQPVRDGKLQPRKSEGRRSWDGSAQMEVFEDSPFTDGMLPGVAEGLPFRLRRNRKSLSLTNLDEDADAEDDEEFHMMMSPKYQSLDESSVSNRRLLSNLSLRADPLGNGEHYSPGSSPLSKDVPDGRMMTGRGLSPYNAKSLQDLASPEVICKESAIMLISPTRRNMFEESSNMTKSLSTPSIPQTIDLAGDHHLKGKHQDEKVYLNFLENYDLFRRQKEIEEIEEEDLPVGEKNFLSEEHSPNDSDEKSGKSGRKEEKRRKPSMFSRFQSSYRTKKSKGKEVKSKEGHNFVAVSFSNSTACDVCHKPVANKAALRCQTCLVNVHDSGCKDQVMCDKRMILKALSRDPAAAFVINHGQGHQPTSQVGSGDQHPPSSANLAADTQTRTAHPAKERRTSSSGYVKSQSSHVPPPLHLTHRYSLPTASLFGSPPDSPLGAAQWSSQISSSRFSLYDKAISEEIESDTASTLESSNIVETISESLESLDADGLVEMQPLEGEPDLNLLAEEPEAWSITVDKRTLKKLSAKDIKRQDTIWELIQTEKQYVKRLRIMQKVFAQTMINDLKYTPEQIDRLFPRIDDLVDLHCGFLQDLLELQALSEDRYVDEIGPLLVAQFRDAPAEKMKSVYGVFCSKHTEAMQSYKDLIKLDRKFQNFAKQCMNLSVCEKRDISDFILGVTVRLSKYPILLEAILKSTKDKKDRESMSQALQYSKEVVQHVDMKVAAYEKLLDIQSKLESRAIMYRGKKFKRQDLTSDGRELIHVGKLGWKTARGRVYDVLAVVLTDVIVFLQRSEQKFAFVVQDNKSCVIPLYRLLVREKNDEKGSVGIYMISQKSSTPEMYEFICQSRTEREEWIRLLQDAIRSCPPEKETEKPVPQAIVPSEEERKEEQTASQIREIIEQLHHQDTRIKDCCDEKNRLIQELMGVSTPDMENRPRSIVQEPGNDNETMEIMQAAMQEASKLTSILHGSESQLSRSVSSVGEHVSDSYIVTTIPRRAETFAGFDSSYESQSSEMSAIKPQQSTSQQGSQDDLTGPGVADVSVDEGTSSLSENSFSTKDLIKTSDSQPPLRTSPSPPKQSANLLLRQAQINLDSSVSELSASPVIPSPSSLEHMASITHLVQYLNALMNITSKQNTKVECLHAELEDAKRQIAKLSADMHGRRTVYGHDQLEELRNLQENINRERQEWERTKNQDKAWLEKEQEKLDAEKANLDKDKRDLHSKREDLKREKEALQTQIDMMRDQGYHISSNVSAEQKSNSSGDASGSHGKTDNKRPTPHHQHSSNNDDGKTFVSHQRSASADLTFVGGNDAADNAHHHHPGPGQLRQTRLLSVGNLAQAKQVLPVHLLSARNEQRMGGAKVQHLPYKLAGAGGNNNNSSSSHAATSNPPSSSHHHPQSQQPSLAKSSQSFLHQQGRAGSTDIKRVQSMMVPSPRSAATFSPRNAGSSGQGRGGSHSNQGRGVVGSSPSGMSGLMKLADPKMKTSVGSSAAGGGGSGGGESAIHNKNNKGSPAANSGSAAKSKSAGHKGNSSSDGIIFF